MHPVAESIPAPAIVRAGEHTGGRAYREGDWKLVAEFLQPWMLHNLREDRTEMTDLSTKYPEGARRMEIAWQQWADEVGVIP